MKETVDSGAVDGSPTSDASCWCKQSMGIRVSGHDKQDLSNDVIRQAEKKGYDDIIIGHGQCKKWYKEDKAKWCVVGFDSACSDRTPITLSLSEGKSVRLWKSSLPCHVGDIMEDLEHGMDLCSTIRMIWIFFDMSRYLLAWPMAYMTYRFLKMRCQDHSEDMGNAFHVDEESSDSWSSSSSSSSSETERVVQKEKKKSKKSKAKPKSQQAKKETQNAKEDVDSEEDW